MQSVLGDVDLIAENQFQRLRQFADDRRLLAVPRRRRRPRLVVSVVLRRQPHAEDATASFGVLDDPLRPVLGRSCARSRETPIGRPTGRSRHRERRCCPARAVPSAAARRSGSRILLAASCPDSERDGRTNPDRCPVVPPSSRSGRATRAFGPARPEWPPRRRTRRARLVRSVTARGRLEDSGGGTLRGRPWHPRASRPCRSRPPGRSTSRPGAADRRQRRTAGLRVVAGQMPANDVVGHRKESAIGTLSALDARLLADAAHPLVGARGRIARLARLPALESTRVDVVATAEQRTEQRDLGLRG